MFPSTTVIYLCSLLNVLTFFPLTGGCSEGLDAFRFFFEVLLWSPRQDDYIIRKVLLLYIYVVIYTGMSGPVRRAQLLISAKTILISVLKYIYLLSLRKIRRGLTRGEDYS